LLLLARRFVRTYDANCYLLLSKCMDLQDLGDGVAGRATYAEGASRIQAEALLVGVKQDALIPAAELRSLAASINATHAASLTPPASEVVAVAEPSAAAATAAAATAAPAGPARSEQRLPTEGVNDDLPRATYLELDSVYGHDAFLKEPGWLKQHLQPFLERGLEEQLAAEERHNTGDNAP